MTCVHCTWPRQDVTNDRALKGLIELEPNYNNKQHGAMATSPSVGSVCSSLHEPKSSLSLSRFCHTGSSRDNSELRKISGRYLPKRKPVPWSRIKCKGGVGGCIGEAGGVARVRSLATPRCRRESKGEGEGRGGENFQHFTDKYPTPERGNY